MRCLPSFLSSSRDTRFNKLRLSKKCFDGIPFHLVESLTPVMPPKRAAAAAAPTPAVPVAVPGFSAALAAFMAPSTMVEEVETEVSEDLGVLQGKKTKKKVALDPVDAVSLERLEELLADPAPVDDGDVRVQLDADDMCDETYLHPGSVLYRPARLVVIRKEPSHYVVRSVDSVRQEWRLEASLIRKQCESPDQFGEVKQVTTAQIAHIIMEQAGDHVLKVTYTELPNLEQTAALVREVSKKIEALSFTPKKKDKLFQRLVMRVQKGDVRVLRGYVARGDWVQESDTGIIKFLDADVMAAADATASGDVAQRALNVRTILSVNLKNVKYVVKK